ncbi:MAG: OmpA family protein [Cytophagales bacterium]|nr:OmpA family protein [Cytophagales bacterium]MDW8384417.1 OmpA family protein [Flammeovirgaceae bacterium]
MKKLAYFAGTVVLGSAFLSGCALKQMIKMAKEAKPVVEPSPLELHGDSVSFFSKLSLPPKMLKKNSRFTLEVYSRPTNLEPVKVGELEYDYKNFLDKQGKPVQNPTVEKTISYFYEDKFEQSQLEVKGIAEKGGKSKETPILRLNEIDKSKPHFGRGTITTSRLVLASYDENYMPHNFQYKPEYEPVYFSFYFEKGKSELRKSERKTEDSRKMDAFVAAKNATKTVTITGMHSPEGTETINRSLSSERAEVIKKYYMEMMAKYNYQNEKVDFITKPISLDWTAFKNAVQASTKLTEKQKSDIMAIVNGGDDFVTAELKLQKLPVYPMLVRDIYPPLRTAKVEVLVEKKKMTEPEIVVLAQQIAKGEEPASKLSEQELLFAASKTPDLKEQEALYNVCINQKEGSATAYNNLGAVYLRMSKKTNDPSEREELIKKAITNFEMASKKQESPEIFANLAGAKLALGDKAGALEALNKVKGGSGTVPTTTNALKGYIAITKGNYGEAVQLLSAGGDNPVVLYNKALAYLLKGSKEMNKDDIMKAESAFKDAIEADKNNALAYYGAAITAARLNKEQDVAKFLSQAVTLDSSLKNRAVKDLEFLAFQDKASFREALK